MESGTNASFAVINVVICATVALPKVEDGGAANTETLVATSARTSPDPAVRLAAVSPKTQVVTKFAALRVVI